MKWWWHKNRTDESSENRIRRKYATFRRLLSYNDEALELMSGLQEDLLYVPPGRSVVEGRALALFDKAAEIVQALEQLTGKRYEKLDAALKDQRRKVERYLFPASQPEMLPRLSAWLSEVQPGSAAEVGGKAIMLAEIRSRLGLPVPDGYVLTTEAYWRFCGTPLWKAIRDEFRNLDILDHRQLSAASARMTGLVMRQPLPRAIEVAITERAMTLMGGAGRLAVRSSALGEGAGEKTYAGQYLSLLNVSAHKAVEAYRRVVAARFSERALFYRLSTGLTEVDSPMAVLFLSMVRARASGVMYTRDPSEPKRNVLWITATRGLGADLVSGGTSGDLHILSRGFRPRLHSSRIVRQEEALSPAESEGLVHLPIDGEEAGKPSLTEPELQRLAKIGIRIESHFRAPQDVEWVIDDDGKFWIVQTRNLALAGGVRVKSPGSELGEPILRGGQTVYPGLVSGPVYLAENPEDLKDAPVGSVVLIRRPSPELVAVLPRIGGLVAERGNVAGHTAALLREFKVPSVIMEATALDRFLPGELASLDAGRGNLYRGMHFQRRQFEATITERFQRRPGDVLSRKVLALNLLNPGAINFRPGGVQSVHDVLRFCHEKAVAEMFTINDLVASHGPGSTKRLKSNLPFDLYVLDLGGGLRMGYPESPTVEVSEIVARPFQSLWNGFTHPGVSWTRAMPATLSDLVSVMARSLEPQGGGGRALAEKSYLLVADEYMNINSRLAYHFAMVDACLSDVSTQNYVSFRFAGGGATPARRNLRACFLEACMRHYDFRVERRNDLVNAWLKKTSAEETGEKLDLLGRLMACTCQLDMYMTSYTAMEWYVQQFLAGNYTFKTSDAGLEA